MAARKSTIDHEYLKQLAKQLGRPLETLYVLAGANDPFIADVPSRRAAAEWLAEIWNVSTFNRAHIYGGCSI